MDRLQKYIDNKKVKYSFSRELIYKILLNENDCLTVCMITEKLNDRYLQKVSKNTIYRHLRFFIEYDLAFTIEVSDKAYYCLYKKEQMVFSICTKCNMVEKIEIDLPNELREYSYVTLHKNCKNCR
ncbi:MAG: transcriptional repressor [Campylobacterota bacterium]|nr:transcriptional repressor [Campylobacterota bacterium]